MASGANELEAEISAMLNKSDIKDLTIRDKDLGPLLQLIKSALKKEERNTQNLKILRLERCKITLFDPAELPLDLKHISLQGNRLTSIN